MAAQSSEQSPIRLQRLVAVAGVLLLAACLRWIDIGKAPLSTDEAATSLKSIGIARHADFTLLGTSMSVGMRHSPLEVYLYALPYRLSTDPRLARMFSGVLNVIAIALVYGVGARYFGHRAGFVASLFYAVHPEALHATRMIWKPNMGAPFVVMYVYTGLLGYFENKRWARRAHLPMLSLVVQSHPATVLLAPLTLVLGIYAYIAKPGHRRQLLLDSAVGALLMVVLFIPWAVGLAAARQPGDLERILTSTGGTSRGLGYTFESLSRMLGGWRRDFARPIQPVLTVLGSIWILVKTPRGRRWFPGLAFVLTLFLVPVLSLLLDAKYRDYYSWSQFPMAFLLQGIVLDAALTLAARRQYRLGGGSSSREIGGAQIEGWVAVALIAAVVWKQLSYVNDEYQLLPHTLDDHIAAIDEAVERATLAGKGLIVLIPGPVDGSDLRWETLAEGRDLDIVWSGRAMPLPVDGALLLGPGDYGGRPGIFSEGELLYDYFQLQELPPATDFRPGLVPPAPLSLSNGATMVGFLTDGTADLPVGGQPWSIDMLWRVDAAADDQYKVFVHLVDAMGNQFGQDDKPGLPVAQWRVGDFALNEFEIPVSPELPDTGPLFLRFGMYNAHSQADLLDQSGAPVSKYGLLQIRGSESSAAVWSNGLTLDQLSFEGELLQGPPLQVNATWRTSCDLAPDTHLRWRLRSATGESVFETTTALLETLTPEALPTGAFASERYVLRIPPDIPPGEYALSLEAVTAEADGAGDLYEAPSRLKMQSRERRFDQPPMQHLVEAVFGGQIALTGYDLARSGDMLGMVLHWHALRSIVDDYKYFVHVWHDGELVAQADTMPAQYTYPTSWWAPGEFFSDPVQLDVSDLAAGTYSLTVGMYDPVTGDRLPATLAGGTSSPDDWVTLQQFSIDGNT